MKTKSAKVIEKPNRFSESFLSESIKIINKIDHDSIENVAKLLSVVKREKGRIFFIGSGVYCPYPNCCVSVFIFALFCDQGNVCDLKSK